MDEYQREAIRHAYILQFARLQKSLRKVPPNPHFLRAVVIVQEAAADAARRHEARIGKGSKVYLLEDKQPDKTPE